MLTFDDKATIENAIFKRLHEPGKTEIADLKVENHPNATPPYIAVGVWLILEDRIGREGLIDPRSFFDLPAEFEHSHLLNEIDEIAEQLKVVRRETVFSNLLAVPKKEGPRQFVTGTGLRGRWGSSASPSSERK